MPSTWSCTLNSFHHSSHKQHSHITRYAGCLPTFVGGWLAAATLTPRPPIDTHEQESRKAPVSHPYSSTSMFPPTHTHLNSPHHMLTTSPIPSPVLTFQQLPVPLQLTLNMWRSGRQRGGWQFPLPNPPSLSSHPTLINHTLILTSPYTIPHFLWNAAPESWGWCLTHTSPSHLIFPPLSPAPHLA